MSSDQRHNVPNLSRTPLERAFLEEQDREAARIVVLNKQHDNTVVGGDASLPANQQNKAAAPNATAKDKIYLFPPAFNALREELETNWPALMCTTDPKNGRSLGWYMAFDAPEFISAMNSALDMEEQMDSDDVQGICHRFLNALRKLRNVSPIPQ